MAKYCLFTGADTTAEGYEKPFKKMCLNCVSCIHSENEEGYACENEKVMEAGLAKIKAAVPEGFEIKNIELSPMVLKNPSKKCPHHSLNVELIQKEIVNMF